MAQASPEKPPANGGSGKNTTGGDKNGTAKAADQKNAENNAMQKQQNADAGMMDDPTAMLRADHRKVEQLFDAFEKAKESGQKSQLAMEICKELMVHSLIEEEIFYAACQGHMEERLLNEAQVEHDGIKPLIIEIMEGSPEDQYFEAKVKVLSEDVKHHVKEEEQAEGILAKAKEVGIATPELAQEMAERKEQLLAEARSGRLRPPRTRSFHVAKMQTPGMGRSMGRPMAHDEDDYRRWRGRFRDDDDRRMPPRDEEGRFVTGRSRRDLDDDNRRPHSRYQYEHEGDDRRPMPPRDDEGQFRSRNDDGDDDHRRGRSHGGWYGDPRGHAEAARRGWEEREERGATRSRSEDDDHRRGGWYGDPRGHSEAARRGWEHEDDSRFGRGSRRR